MKANNPFLPDYVSIKPSTLGLFLDLRNLYGGTMMNKCRVGKFKWVEKNLVDFLDNQDKADQGFFVEVDLKYPQRLHDLHNGFPLAAEKLVPKKDMLSKYQLNFFPERQAPTKKLMETETLYEKKTTSAITRF